MSDKTPQAISDVLMAIEDVTPSAPALPARDTLESRAPFWRPLTIAAASFGAVILVVGLTTFGLGGDRQVETLSATQSSAASETPDAIASTVGFSAGEVATMPVVLADHGYDLDDPLQAVIASDVWTTMGYDSALGEFDEALVAAVRDAVSTAMSPVDARPPYEAGVIAARFDPVSEAWSGVMSVSHADGECLVVIEKGAHNHSVCPDSADAAPETLLLRYDEFTPFGGLFDAATASVGDWVDLVWWSLPENVVDVLYWRDVGDGAELDVPPARLTGGTAWTSWMVAGVDLPIRVQARDANGVVVIEDTLTIPAAGTDVPDATTILEYDMDVERFADLLRPEKMLNDGETVISEDTFLGGGSVLGSPWAIVGGTTTDKYKPTSHCVGVSPPLDLTCGGIDFLHWTVLPVGDGGVVVFNGPEDANHVRVAFDDGRVIEVPFVGPSEGYPPIAVVTVERIGENGTAYAITESGDVLFGADFEVSLFAMPGG